MRLFSAAVLAAILVSAQAFRNTSPFLLFSNSPLGKTLQNASNAQLQTKTTAMSAALDILRECSSEIYYVIFQPSVSSSELGAHAPHLKRAIENPGVQTRLVVSEVVGLIEDEQQSLVSWIQNQCGAKLVDEEMSVEKAFKMRSGEGSVVMSVVMPDLGRDKQEREERLEEHDSELYDSILKDLPRGYKCTVIYLTTAFTDIVDDNKVITYDPEFVEAFHMDLKRNFYTNKRENETNSTDFRPLFEKYNYFNPGLFMGFSVSILLLAILSVGISAVSSLQVSYGAFDKEMGPAAQKQQ